MDLHGLAAEPPSVPGSREGQPGPDRAGAARRRRRPVGPLTDATSFDGGETPPSVRAPSAERRRKRSPGGPASRKRRLGRLRRRRPSAERLPRDPGAIQASSAPCCKCETPCRAPSTRSCKCERRSSRLWRRPQHGGARSRRPRRLFLDGWASGGALGSSLPMAEPFGGASAAPGPRAEAARTVRAARTNVAAASAARRRRTPSERLSRRSARGARRRP